MRYEGEGSRRRGHPDSQTDALARGLGVFSIALGLYEVMAPRSLARALGMPRNTGLIQAYGVREIATGIGILAPGIRRRGSGAASRAMRSTSPPSRRGSRASIPRRTTWPWPLRRSPA